MTKYITNWLFKVKGENTKNPFKTGLQNASQLTTGGETGHNSPQTTNSNKRSQRTHVLKLKDLLHFATHVLRFDVWLERTISKVGFGKENSFPSIIRELWRLYWTNYFSFAEDFLDRFCEKIVVRFDHFWWQSYEAVVRSIREVEGTMRLQELLIIPSAIPSSAWTNTS